ncbi:MAG: PKD domain-containing protein, partial [Bacteroidota bacterium]
MFRKWESGYIWYIFTIVQAGTIEWTASPQNTGFFGTEFDFAMWDLSGGCPGILTVCNWNFENATGADNGMGMGMPNLEYEPAYNATVGQTFAIQLDNWSDDGTGFDFTWGGTAEIEPVADFTINPSGIQCASSVTVNITDNSIGAPTYDFGDGSPTYTGNSPPSHTYTTPGTYAITAVFIGACPSSHTEFVELYGPLSTTTSTIDETCPGFCDGEATVFTTGGDGIYSYSWSNGGTLPVITNLCTGTYIVTVSNATCGTSITDTVIITASSPMTLTLTPTPASCGGSDGTASVIASGGTGPYTYLWTPGGATNDIATGLSAGTYTVAVTDANGCMQTDSVTVINIGGGTANITSSVNVNCFGGSNGVATVTASGGTTPYTYSWSPSGGNTVIATGLAAGFYTITVIDANGCIAIDTVTITEPPLLITTITSSSMVSCYGNGDGTATVSASGGTTSYSYFWTPSGGSNATATGLSPGTYTATVIDANGCSGSDAITITEPSQIILTLSSTQATCGNADGSTSVIASGGIPLYTYSWTPGGDTNAVATGLTGGLYTVDVTDANGCVVTDTITVSESSSVALNFTSNDAACSGSCDGSATANPSGGISPYTYQWDANAGNQTTQTATGLCTGAYNVIVTDGAGCADTDSIIISEPNGLSSSFSTTGVICYGQCNGSATVTTSGGTSPYTSLWDDPGSQATSTATGLCPGNYTYTLTDANGCIDITNVTINEPPLLTLNF